MADRSNKKTNAHVEFGVEFGDINASKVLDTQASNKNKEKDPKNKDQKEK